MSGKKAKLLRKIAKKAFPEGFNSETQYNNKVRHIEVRGWKEENGTLVENTHLIEAKGQRTHGQYTFKRVLAQMKKFNKESREEKAT